MLVNFRFKKYFLLMCLILFLNLFFAFSTLAGSSGYLKYYDYAQNMMRQKQYVNADMALSQGLRKYPTSERLLIARATNRANNLGDIQGAIKDYSHILKLYPGNYKFFFRRGSWLYKMGQYSYALKDFNRALSINPKYGKVYLERAKVYAKFGDINKAKKDLATLARISPKYKRAADELYRKIINGNRDF